MRPQRMPQIEDLPVPVQNQIRQQIGSGDGADVKRRTLLERLAAFGQSREELGAPMAQPERSTMPPQLGYGQPQQQPGYRPLAPTPVHSEYAKRPAAPGGHLPTQRQPLDQHGRMAPAPRPSDDDQLEIPAFLRRQTN